MENAPLLRPGATCWRVERARRLAFLVDGAAYFGALRRALLGARHSVFILGWDIDSRLRLARDGADDGWPETLLDLLNAVLARRRGLSAHVLTWDFAMLYALEREWLPLYRLPWRCHHRLHFAMDNAHPVGGSQHQKVVVVDDRLAFAGGMDLARWRWDTPGHRPGDPGRVDPSGRPYPPFHDVQVMVEGPVAAALGDLARERWRRAGVHPRRLPAPAAPAAPAAPDGPSPWPEGVAPDLTDVDVAVARTLPAYGGRPAVGEVERLHLEAVAAARRFIYIENQYLTSHRVGEALARRLAEPDGPEVVMVLPERTGGWLERNTMDVLRARLVRTLERADAGGRLRLYAPRVPGLGDEAVSVHAKVMVVDDRLVRVGSANLSNRSMGLDAECDLAVEAADGRTAEAIAAFRDGLLAEHLGCPPDRVKRTLAETGSLARAVDRLRGGARTLAPLECAVAPEIDRLVPEAGLLDPERPIAAEDLAARFLPEEERRPAARWLVTLAALLGTFLALAAAWRLTPMGDWLRADAVARWVGGLGAAWPAPLLVLAGYLVGGLVAVPVSVLVVVTVLALGPVQGFPWSMAGIALSAAATYGLGALAGRDPVRRLAGRRLNALSRRLARRGLLTVVAVRLVPVAPFPVVNLVAGASHIRFRDFALGTLLGTAPGTAALTLFADRVAAAVREPGPGTLVVLAAVTAAIAVGAVLLHRWPRRRD